MAMKDLVPLLFIIQLLMFAKMTKADKQNINNSELRGRFYKLENEINLSYENKAIMTQIVGISLEQCLLECSRKRGCKHISFLDGNQQCKLLAGVVNKMERKVKDLERIFTFLPGK